MYCEILAFTFLVTYAQAVGEATSFVKFNGHHNSIQHIQSNTGHGYEQAPVQYSAPAYQKLAYNAPTLSSSSESAGYSGYSVGSNSYTTISDGHQNAAVAYELAPQVLKKEESEENHGPVKYEFAYGVEDHHTGDIHSHKESRDGYLTQGEYSLHEPDGTIRTVKYTVDKHSGFNAKVERSGHSQHPVASQHSNYH